MKTEKFQITGMTCSSCQAHITKSVQKLKGVSDVDVNLLLNTMIVRYDEESVNNDEIINAVFKAGYGASLSGNKVQSNFRVEWEKKQENEIYSRKVLKRRLVSSLILLFPLFYISMGGMIGLSVPEIFAGAENTLILAFTQLLLTIPVVVINGNFFVSGFRAFYNKMPNMDSLVALGSGASLLYGIIAIYMMMYELGHENSELVSKYSHMLYFESCATILTLVTVGKYLEAKAKVRTSDTLGKLVNLSPKTAFVIRDGHELTIPSEQVISGDIVVIKPGEIIPVDGVVIEGYGYVDQSSITGESVPVVKNEGDEVISATVNKNGCFKFRASNVGEDTTLAKIIKLVEDAGSSKAPVARLADKVSGFFVPAVIAISLFTAVLWLLAGETFEFALNCAISVLVISCPCALGLATPVAIMVGIGKAAEYGILIKSAEILEKLHSIDTVVLDKTGTVTSGHPIITDVEVFDEDISGEDFLAAAACIENGSEHPLAEAVLNKAKEEKIEIKTPDKFEIFPGEGIHSVVDGQDYFAGNISLMEKHGVEKKDGILLEKILEKYAYQGKTPLFFARNKTLIGVISISDRIRDTSTEAVRYLKKMGIRVILLTGDNKLTAEAVAKEADIDEVISDVRPEEKDESIRKLKDDGAKVAMVGDGINDAPALIRADIGIAVGTGTDIAVDAADIVLMKDSLLGVVTALGLSKTVVKNIHISLFWAFFYNIVGIPVAAGIFYPLLKLLLSPMIAAAAMSLSSVCVVINALRIRLFKDNIRDEDIKQSHDELFIQKKGDSVMKKIMEIDGMMCAHCQKRVHDLLSALDGVVEVDVNLENKTAVVVCSKDVDDKIFIDTVEDAGYKVQSLKTE